MCVAGGEGVTCPFGCLGCDCNSPDTPIATPTGDRAIATLRAGDLVYSIDGSAIVAVPILLAVENPVHGHHVVRLRLSNGVTLEISANHPLADGRTIGQLAGGDSYEDAHIEATERIPYAPAATFDILPSSSTGIYFAAGLPLRSTLR